jgi:hypothetical protein
MILWSLDQNQRADDARDLTVSRLQEYWDSMGMDITDISG